MYKFACIFALSILFISCKNNTSIDIPTPEKEIYGPQEFSLSSENYIDKVKGAIVGSAIGDAMGASTEMWDRKDIQAAHGYINGLTYVNREKSPEGPWGDLMQEGSTTDDTRWKYLISQYLLSHKQNIRPTSFAKFISDYYDQLLDEMKSEGVSNFEESLDKLNWVKEWAEVSQFYKDRDAYQQKLHAFYGGEMSCAGLLYAPVFGLITEDLGSSYLDAYKLAIFDLGYAKDISALSAVLTRMALESQDLDTILSALEFVDPYDYKNSRLIGRLSISKADDIIQLFNNLSQNNTLDSLHSAPPDNYPGNNMDWAIQDSLYKYLDSKKEKIAFHAGEIWQILIASMVYGQGDFMKTMQFIVNYGRDNDTVAAIAGTIIGGMVGYENLPPEIAGRVIDVHNSIIGIDLEQLSNDIASLRDVNSEGQ